MTLYRYQGQTIQLLQNFLRQQLQRKCCLPKLTNLVRHQLQPKCYLIGFLSDNSITYILVIVQHTFSMNNYYSKPVARGSIIFLQCKCSTSMRCTCFNSLILKLPFALILKFSRFSTSFTPAMLIFTGDTTNKDFNNRRNECSSCHL